VGEEKGAAELVVEGESVRGVGVEGVSDRG